MVTYAEMKPPEVYLNVPRIEWAEVRLLWHSKYWDGVISGMLLYQGERCWFEMVEESESESWYRRFAVLRLSPEQLAEEEHWHELFRLKVGVHTDYEGGGRQLGNVLPRDTWREFYDAYEKRKPRDFAQNEVLGWVER